MNSVNSVSFNGWSQKAMSALQNTIAEGIPGSERVLASKLVRNLEEHSPHHFLSYENGILSAEANGIGVDSFRLAQKEITDGGLANALKKMTKFVARQNSIMPKRWRRIGFMWHNLAYISRKLPDEPGLVIEEHVMPVYLSRLVDEIEKSKKSFDFQNVVRQIKNIDDKAAENGLQVFILPAKDGGTVIRKGKEVIYKANKPASIERLNDTEKFIEMYARETQSLFPDWSVLEQYKIQAQAVEKKRGILSKIVDKIFFRR